MKIDRYQRTVLRNQYLILDKLAPNQGWAKSAKIFENGYEFEYEECLVASDIVSEDACREVRDILQMFRVLYHAKSNQKFEGFDGNHHVEGPLMGYVRHLWESSEFTESKHPDIDNGNSHTEMLAQYRRMVAAWKQGPSFPLSPEDVSRIEKAAKTY